MIRSELVCGPLLQQVCWNVSKLAFTWQMADVRQSADDSTSVFSEETVKTSVGLRDGKLNVGKNEGVSSQVLIRKLLSLEDSAP